MLRWEDEEGPARSTYDAPELEYTPAVEQGDLAVGIWAACDVVDWRGCGAQDLLVSCWEGCYEGGAYIFLSDGRSDDGTPRLLPGRRLPGVEGFVSAGRRGPGRMSLIAAARRERRWLLYPDLGSAGEPRPGPPSDITAASGPIALDETPSRVVTADLDRDGVLDLVIGTDVWRDYWPDGKGWGDRQYVPYDAQGRWRGGPLRGHLFWLRSTGGVLDDPRIILADGKPLEVYGAAAPAFGDFLGKGRCDLVCGDFLDRLHFFPATDRPAEFGPGAPVRAADGGALSLPQNIHSGCAADWDGDGRLDLVMGAEDGYIYFCRGLGRDFAGAPAFDEPLRVQQTRPRLNAGSCPIPAVGDLDGDGRPDLVVGNAAGHLLYYRNVGERGRPRFAREVFLTADGEVVRIQAGARGSIQGPSEAKWGYTNPLLADWDGDGLLDLLVSDIFGRHAWYRNLGSPRAPEFAPGVRLTFRGAPLETVWRVRPAVGNLFGPVLHYVCLDEHGLLAAYAKASETALADKALLRYDDGQTIAFTEDYGGGRGRMKLCLCDWTGNGLPDLLVGTHRGASLPPGPDGIPRHDINQATVLLLENVGRPGEPAFARPRYIRYRGRPIRLGVHSCAPQAVDWSGTGAACGRVRGFDLIVGAESGCLLDMRREHLSW